MLVANGYAPDPRVHKEARTLTQHGFSVTVLCWDRQRNRPSKEILDGVVIRRFRYLLPKGISSYLVSGMLFLVTCLFELAKEGVRHDKIVVHCHDFNTLPVGWLLRSLSRRYRLVYDSHESFSDLVLMIAPKVVAVIVRASERMMVTRVDGLIAANDMILQNLQPYSKKRGVAIYNTPSLAISRLGIRVGSKIGSLRDQWGRKKFFLLYYGAIIRDRGLFALLDAAGMTEDVVFVAVGDGPLRPSLQSEARSRRLANVRFYPHVPFEAAMLMVKAADAVYIGFEPEDPNNYFASPNKLFEAMAMSKPVLASGFGLLGRLVARMGCGVTMKSIDGPSILEGIQKLLDRDTKSKCGVNGFCWFRSQYNWEAMERRLITVYNGVNVTKQEAYHDPQNS
jgi:glycosyltransferase involved in cell wall biosynthesis